MSSRTQQPDDPPPPPPPLEEEDEEPQYVMEAASLSYCEASEFLRHAMDEAKRALIVQQQQQQQQQQKGRGGGVGGGGSSPSTTSATAAAMASPRSGVEAMQEVYAGKVDNLERQLTEALGQRAGLERALHHAAADALRAQNDVKLAKKETEQVRQQLVLTEAELHKKVEELARRPVETESGLPADEELKMRHNVAVLRAEIALLSDLVNRSPDQQMQMLQRKVSELTADSLKAAEAARSREALLSDVHQRHQAAMERMAHAEDKRDAALSRCATLEDDNAALQRALDDATRALRHQTQTAQSFAAALSRQIVAHENSARAAVGRDHAVEERELALYGAGLKTRSLLEQSERQAALRMHMLRELSSDTTSGYAKDRIATRYFIKWVGYVQKRRTSSLRTTTEQLREAETAREHADERAATAEERAFEQVKRVKDEAEQQIVDMRKQTQHEISEALALSSSTREAIAIEREHMEAVLQTLHEEFTERYDIALLALVRERGQLVMLANQGMINIRDALTKEFVDREQALLDRATSAEQDLATVRAAAGNAMQDAESHQSIMERALQEAKRQRDKQEAEFKQIMARQQHEFEARERRLQLELEKKAARSKEEADRIEKKFQQAQQELSEKERRHLADAEKQRRDQDARQDDRSKAFQQLQEAMAAEQAAARNEQQQQQQQQSPGQLMMSTDESVAHERARRRWLVENIKQVVDGLEQCYLDDVASCMGNGLEPTAITNLRAALVRRAGHTARVIECWQRREKALMAMFLWMSFALGRSKRKLRQHANRSIQDLSQKLTRVKDIAQEAIREKKSMQNALQHMDGERDKTNSELEALKADHDALRRAHAMKKAELQRANSPSRDEKRKRGGGDDAVDPETRAVLASARGQIEQLSELLKRSRESEEQHALVIEQMSEKLNQETAAAAELKATIVALLSQAQEAGADLSAAKAGSERTAESLYVLESRPALIKDLVDLLKTLEADPVAAKAAAQKVLQTHATASERQQFRV